MHERVVVSLMSSGHYLSQGSKKPVSYSHCLCATVRHILFPEGNCGYIVRTKKLRCGEPVCREAVSL